MSDTNWGYEAVRAATEAKSNKIIRTQAEKITALEDFVTAVKHLTSSGRLSVRIVKELVFIDGNGVEESHYRASLSVSSTEGHHAQSREYTDAVLTLYRYYAGIEASNKLKESD